MRETGSWFSTARAPDAGGLPSSACPTTLRASRARWPSSASPAATPRAALGVAAGEALDGQRARDARSVVGQADDGKPPASGARAVENQEPVSLMQGGLHGSTVHAGDSELALCHSSPSSSWTSGSS